MMKRIAIATALVIAGMAGTVSAQDNPVVVELFTSQGCSSCPPADAILAELARRDDVIALALHVDYWDYIGWKDEFADPAFTVRQRGYARAAGSRSIFTPQMIIAGEDHVIGAKPMKLNELLMKHSGRPSSVKINLSRDGNQVNVAANADKKFPTGAVVQVVTYIPKARVNIRRGENAGHTFDYYNVVQDLIEVGTWDGRSPFRASARVPTNLPVVVLIQEQNSGPMLGAARLR